MPGGGAGREVGWLVWGRRRKRHCREGLSAGGRGEGLHLKHARHACDAGGVPAGNVRVKVGQVLEEPAHVGDARDVPVVDGAVLQFGGGHVCVVLYGRRPQPVLSVNRACTQASPSRAVRSIKDCHAINWVALPCATDQHLGFVGQGACTLPSRKEGDKMQGGAWTGRRGRLRSNQHAQGRVRLEVWGRAGG